MKKVEVQVPPGRYVHVQTDWTPSKENNDLRYDEDGNVIPPARGEFVVFYEDDNNKWGIECLYLGIGGGSGRHIASGMEKNAAILVADVLNQRAEITPVRSSKIGEMRAYQADAHSRQEAERVRHRKAMMEIAKDIEKVTATIKRAEVDESQEDYAYRAWQEYVNPPEPYTPPWRDDFEIEDRFDEYGLEY